MKKQVYIFKHIESGEIVRYARIRGEYREVSEDIWRAGKRLYPYYPIHTLRELVAELVELNYVLYRIA